MTDEACSLYYPIVQNELDCVCQGGAEVPGDVETRVPRKDIMLHFVIKSLETLRSVSL